MNQHIFSKVFLAASFFLCGFFIANTASAGSVSPILSYTINSASANAYANPVSKVVQLGFTADQIINNWVSIKIVKTDNSAVYKIFYPQAFCDGVLSCVQSWDGTMSSGVLSDGTYNIIVHIENTVAPNTYDLTLTSPYTITVDTVLPTATLTGIPSSWTNQSQLAGTSCQDTNSGCDSANSKIFTHSSGMLNCNQKFTLSSPQTVSSYSWVCGAVYDLAGNLGVTEPIEFKIDTTAPTGHIINYAEVVYTQLSVPIHVFNNGSDSQSGLNLSTAKIQRAQASLSNGKCENFGLFTDIVTGPFVPTGETPAFTDTSVINGKCYQYQYVMFDNAGNSGVFKAPKIIQIIDNIKPTIELVGDNPMTIQLHSSYTEPGANVIDDCDTLTAIINGTVDTDTVGSYSVYYDATDLAGNSATQVIRTVNVIDSELPSTTDNIPAVWQTSDFLVTFNCTDNGACSKVYYTTDGSDPTTESSYVDVLNNWQFLINVDGQYVIKYFGVDASQNQEPVKTATNILKLDKTPPNIVLPADITQNTTNTLGTVINFVVSATDSRDGAVEVTCDKDSGINFAVGETNVTCQAKDSVNNLSEGTFKITVVYSGNQENNNGGDGGGGSSGNSSNGTINNPVNYNILALAGINGSVSPSGNIQAYYLENKEFLITPNEGYKIQDVLVDGVSRGAIEKYTFSEIDSNHTIVTYFSSINVLPPPAANQPQGTGALMANLLDVSPAPEEVKQSSNQILEKQTASISGSFVNVPAFWLLIIFSFLMIGYLLFGLTDGTTSK